MAFSDTAKGIRAVMSRLDTILVSARPRNASFLEVYLLPYAPGMRPSLIR